MSIPCQKLAPTSVRKTQGGATLIEVLVAIFLLAVGLLGMASLTASATSYNKISQIRGVGSMLVSDLADRARANLLGFDDNRYTHEPEKFGTTSPPATCATPYSGTNAPVGTEASTAAQCVAEMDLHQWLTEVRARLPGGDAQVTSAITRDAATNRGVRVMNVYIAWQEQEAADGMNLASTDCPVDTPGAGYRCMYFRVAL